jgi:uncharacterized protein (PEP-CTERM system associated)
MATTTATLPGERRHCGGARWQRKSALAWACCSAMLLGASGSAAAEGIWRTNASVGGTVTWTNNVNLERGNERESDWVFTISPAASVDYLAARASLRGTVAAPIVVYAGTGSDNNTIYPNAALQGNVELIEDFFFVDAAVSVSQTYYSPFGPRPPGLVNQTDNRYTSQSYRVSPYLQRTIGSDIAWSIRNDNIWTNLNNTPEATGGQYINRLIATINREARPFGWGADVERTAYRFENQDPQTLALARARATWRPDPQLELFATGGYERTDFPLSSTSDAIYGGGFRWRPTERTRFDTSWEQRFFGSSYDVVFEHRLPLSFWTVRASRALSSYPEVIASLQEGTSVSAILDQALRSRIPDPDERAQYVQEFMTDRGLPEFVDQPVSVYSLRLYVAERAVVSAGLVGARNGLTATAYYLRQQPITGSGEVIPPAIAGTSDSTQTGLGATWTYRLSTFSVFTLSAGANWTKAQPPNEDRSDQQTLRAVVTNRLGPKTTTSFGASWQNYDSNTQSDYQEISVFAAITHSFR